MFGKLFCFIFFVFLSGMCYVATGNVSTIICDNTLNSCYLKTENKILKTSHKANSVKINRNIQSRLTERPTFFVSVEDENSSQAISYKKRHEDYLCCNIKTHKIKTNDGYKDKTEYFLVAKKYRGANNSNINYLHKYSSKAACELDRMVVEAYLTSDNENLLIHRVVSSKLNFLWYVGVAVFGLLAIIILFAKTVSAEEAVYYKTAYNDGDCGLTEEQKKAFCDKVQGIVNFTSKLNSDITEKITDIANQAGKIEIDIDDKDK